MRDRHLLGAGAAACAVCCAPPLLALVGIAAGGAAAAIATAAFAGIAFGLVILVAAVIAFLRMRRVRATSCAPEPELFQIATGPTSATDLTKGG
ncbi:hypothetical protein [Promicromonospora iranensis]|uniref:Lipid-binding transport protein (Tim44 family) n=1 Tax=Promicromonospora iranensis TaxID=1105144 RepID=A0ABU2CIJ2_9MICO|nr:hypothetical protein [Promicromonospora iranensis]MDR7381145.1 putative lipid-binding transport protein (Tim44 family) [Promicromonospora iranensis]